METVREEGVLEGRLAPSPPPVNTHTPAHTPPVTQSQKGSDRVKCGSKLSEPNPISAGGADG